MGRLVLFSDCVTSIDEGWLRQVAPQGTRVRAIPLPGFMLNDARETAAISVRVYDAAHREGVIEWLTTEARPRPPRVLLDMLAARPLTVELDVLRGAGQAPPFHPIARSIAQALDAIVEHDDRLYDSEMTDLSAAHATRRAKPKDATGAIDFSKFAYEHFWVGKVDAPWLGGEVSVLIEGDADRIPARQRHVVERVAMLPSEVRASLESFLVDKIPTLPFDPPKKLGRADVWRLVSQPWFNVPAEPRRRACFSVSFECRWDPEHGISVLFDDRARPVRIGSQGDFF